MSKLKKVNPALMKHNTRKTVVLTRPQHPLSRELLDHDALYVLRKLRREGFMAYLVGGAVRDILLGRVPKDFDIGTDATPSALRSIFQNSRTIGRRFRIIHVFFRRKGEADKVIEVSTFRANRPITASDKVHPDDVDQTGTAFGTPEEDAWRRDFTVNALLYNIEDFTIVDHTGGLKDLEEKLIRIIGDPDDRFADDPVRMLRAIEFAVRLGFSIEKKTEDGIRRNAALITEASPARLREELRQMHQKGITGDVLMIAAKLGLFQHLFPEVEGEPAIFELMRHLDRRAAGGGQSPEYAYIAAMVIASAEALKPFGPQTGLEEAHDAVYPLVAGICDRYQISAHIRHMARELLLSCYRLAKGQSYRAKGKFAKRAEFSVALDFLEAWMSARGVDSPELQYWQKYLSERERGKEPAKPRKRRRPRRRGRKPGAPQDGTPAE